MVWYGMPCPCSAGLFTEPDRFFAHTFLTQGTRHPTFLEHSHHSTPAVHAHCERKS
ncbi:hypothetical protein BDV97DRAFT_346781 [Delphinella strobiligena]|nr:hypothetical protein BDV97DRAFT_346781 [Delphinella strobiligena]